MKSWIRIHPDSCTLSVYIQAGAKKSEVVGEHGQALKIRIAAPRVEGSANKALIAFLAKLLSVRQKDIQIMKGDLSKIKVVAVVGSSAEEIEKAIGI
jgi:uncharacterized protein